MPTDASRRRCQRKSTSKPNQRSPWACSTTHGNGACPFRPSLSMLATEIIPTISRGLDERQVPYICAVESTFGCRLPNEVQATAAQAPVYGGRGQPRKPRPAPLYTVKQLIEALPASAWQTIQWREGTKGTMQVQAVALRVHWATGSSLHSTSHSRVYTGPEGWLLAERPVPAVSAAEASPTLVEPQEKEEGQIKYWF